ncbi:MAG: VWA domain-containing protein [Bacteroidales bacterium]|nr:VWA domain-containing protein [Bacteroidales bacterium]
MIFAEPKYLMLLLLIPVFFVIQALVLKFRAKRIRRFGDQALVEKLMPSYSKAKVWLRLSLFAIAFLFFILGISRPQMGAILKEHKTRGAEVMVVLDVSNSMLAQDYSPNRLERAKLAISRMVDKLRDDRIGLIVFAGNSFVQLPITTDYVSAKMFLSSISTESVPIQGTAMGEAISTALRSFSAQSDKSRAIIVITDGENHEDDPVAAARQAAELGVRVFTIGVGSPQGTMIPMGDGQYLEDREGNPVVTRLDDKVLQDVAEAGKGLYVHAGNREFGLDPIIEEISRMDDEEYNSIVFEEYDELYMYFLAVAFFFLVLEMLIGDRRSKRHLFVR